jgi:REP element-mobilizing transposase RayT
MAKQLSLTKTAGWGGKRRGAGRKPNGDRAGVSHRTRPSLDGELPLHVTVRVRDGVWSLRGSRVFQIVKASFHRNRDRFGFRLNHFSVQGNHMHLVVEANDKRALWRGIHAIEIRIALAINRLMGRRGRVFADRYHARILRTPTETRNVLRYQLHNRERHTGVKSLAIDPRTSWGLADPPTVAPETWLLRKGWRRARVARCYFSEPVCAERGTARGIVEQRSRAALFLAREPQRAEPEDRAGDEHGRSVAGSCRPRRRTA